MEENIGSVDGNLRDAIMSENMSKFAVTGALEGIVKIPDTNLTKKLHMQ